MRPVAMESQRRVERAASWAVLVNEQPSEALG